MAYLSDKALQQVCEKIIAVKEEDSHKVLIVGKFCPLMSKWYVATCSSASRYG